MSNEQIIEELFSIFEGWLDRDYLDDEDLLFNGEYPFPMKKLVALIQQAEHRGMEKMAKKAYTLIPPTASIRYGTERKREIDQALAELTNQPNKE